MKRKIKYTAKAKIKLLLIKIKNSSNKRKGLPMTTPKGLTYTLGVAGMDNRPYAEVTLPDEVKIFNATKIGNDWVTIDELWVDNTYLKYLESKAQEAAVAASAALIESVHETVIAQYSDEYLASLGTF